MNDLRFALRQLLKNPGFTAVAVLTLALGIGATTAIFSVVHAVLLQPLPYPEPDRLVRIHETIPVRGVERVPVSVTNYLDWRRQASSFAEMAAHRWVDINLTGAGEARRLVGARVTSGFFGVLGVPPILGRSFNTDEEARGRHQVAVISEQMWRRDFGGEASVLGRSLTLDGEAHTIVGVMPSRMRYPSRSLDIWIPSAFFESELTQRGNHGWSVVARLKPGIAAGQAGIEMSGIAGRIAAAFEDVKDFNARVVPLHEDVVGDKRMPLLVLLGAVGCVLAIACANVANLLLARASSRRKEFAIRAALGAGWGTLLRQLLLESVTLSSVGGGFGILLAYAGVAVFRALPPQLLPRADEIRLSLPVLFFALGVSLGTGLLFGLVPAIRASGSDANEVLKDGGRGGSEGLRRNRYRASLVVAEVALSMVLLAGAGLLLRSFIKLQEVDPGFRAEGIATANLLLPDSAYPTEGRQAAVFQQVLERLKAQPGVEAAGAVFGLPQGAMRSKVTFEIEGRGRSSGTDSTEANYRQVSRDYFSTLEIPILRGRDFGSGDTTNSMPVAVVNAAFVKRYFPKTPPGEIPTTRFNIEGGTNTWLQIVGVVGDVRSEGASKPPEPEVFLPFSQRCWGYASLVVRTRQDPATMGPVLRAAVAAVDSNLPLDAVRPLESLLAENLADRRLQAQLLTGFSILALVLAATGIYGVMAYSVSRRIQEIGIRMALGAKLEDVLVLVLRQGMGLTLAGILIGLAGGLAVARALSGLLFEIQPTDPPTFGGVTVLLAAVALFACWWPARRAAKVDPMVALRSESRTALTVVGKPPFDPSATMKPSIREVPADEVLALRTRQREMAGCQIVHDSIHRREGWTRTFLIEVAGNPVGFAEVAIAGPWMGKPTVFEFHLLPEFACRVFELFERFLRVTGVRFFEAQTNCGPLGVLAHTYGLGITSERILFRDGMTTTLPANGAVLRPLTDDAEIQTALERRRGGGEWRLEVDGIEVGKGGILFHYNRPYGDIHMDVSEPYRRRGLGSFLVQELKRRCWELGAVPCARCNPSNVASFRTLQKAGFVPCGQILVGGFPESGSVN